MCQAITLPRSEVPLALLGSAELAGREFQRWEAAEPEVWFHWRHTPALLPVWLDGRIRVVRWGNRERRGRLPPGGWTWRESVEAGKWVGLRAEPVVVPAAYVLVGGTWTRCREGVQGVCVRDPAAGPTVYVVVERASRYFGVMTRSDWAPALVGETI